MQVRRDGHSCLSQTLNLRNDKARLAGRASKVNTWWIYSKLITLMGLFQGGNRRLNIAGHARFARQEKTALSSGWITTKAGTIGVANAASRAILFSTYGTIVKCLSRKPKNILACQAVSQRNPSPKRIPGRRSCRFPWTPGGPKLIQPLASQAGNGPTETAMARICFVSAGGKLRPARKFEPLALGEDSNGKVSWRWNYPEVPRTLYNLHLLAKRPDADVLIVEGEKAADAAGKLFPEMIPITSRRRIGVTP